MPLDKYVPGRRDPNTGEVDESTFCYRLEHELRKLSGIKGRGADKFGIYFGKTSQQYEYNQNMYKSPEEAFNAIKNEINITIQAGGQFHLDKNRFSLSEKLEGGNYYDIERFVRSKILSVYYPDDFLQIHTVTHLAIILSALKEKIDDFNDK
jgi:hypothetical protein